VGDPRPDGLPKINWSASFDCIVRKEVDRDIVQRSGGEPGLQRGITTFAS